MIGGNGWERLIRRRTLIDEVKRRAGALPVTKQAGSLLRLYGNPRTRILRTRITRMLLSVCFRTFISIFGSENLKMRFAVLIASPTWVPGHEVL